jgi:hypothetical protein
MSNRPLDESKEAGTEEAQQEDTQQSEVPKKQYSASRVRAILSGCPQELIDSTVGAMGDLDMLEEEERREEEPPTMWKQNSTLSGPI